MFSFTLLPHLNFPALLHLSLYKTSHDLPLVTFYSLDDDENPDHPCQAWKEISSKAWAKAGEAAPSPRSSSLEEEGSASLDVSYDLFHLSYTSDALQ